MKQAFSNLSTPLNGIQQDGISIGKDLAIQQDMDLKPLTNGLMSQD
jgi:hypothetical protein